jgi:hypothetical protein
LAFRPSNAFDTYIQYADQSLYSNECPCNVTTGFNNIVTNSTAIIQNFQCCPTEAHTLAYNGTIANDGDFDPEKNFNQTEFWELMSRLEYNYECSGWSNASYIDTYNKTVMIDKYLFSDVKRGPPKKSGCLQFITIGNLSLKASSMIMPFGLVSLIAIMFEVIVYLY